MAKRPGHVDVVTEVGFCNFCGRTRNLRREEHHLGGLLRVVTTCEACHRTLSSTMEVAPAQDETKAETKAEPEPRAEKPEPAAKAAKPPAAVKAAKPPAAVKSAKPAAAKRKPTTTAKAKAPAKPPTKVKTPARAAAKPRTTAAPKKTARGK